jgi:hypothetical protein
MQLRALERQVEALDEKEHEERRQAHQIHLFREHQREQHDHGALGFG